MDKWMKIIWLVLGVFFLVLYLQNVSNGRYQYIPRGDWVVPGETGTVVMDTRDATIYHIAQGALESFNPMTAKIQKRRLVTKKQGIE